MSLQANTFRFFTIVILAGSVIAPSQAQSLGQANPVERLTDVVQFGVPRDHKYVLCESGECPQRSIKHLQPPPREPAPPLIITELPEPPKPAVSRAKAKPAKKTAHKRKPTAKKAKAEHQNKPVAEK